MTIAGLRPRTQVLLCFLVPTICLAVGLFLVWPAVSRLGKVKEDLDETQQTIEQKQKVITSAESAAEGRPLALAVAPSNDEEPIIFLRQLAYLATQSGGTLASMRATTPPPLPANPNPQQPTGSITGQPASGSSESAGLRGSRPVVPSTVRELTDQVTVEGTFPQILDLLVRLESFERILSISQCRIGSGGGAKYPRLQAVFTLSRFVASPQAQPTAPNAGTTAR